MKLCLDVGNTHIYGGVFSGDVLRLQFRHDTKQASSSDQLGLFLRSVLRENEIDPKEIIDIAVCSVVPAVDYSLRAACIKYFKKEPFFLQAGVKTGLKIKYHNPLEVGADRISTAIAAVKQFPNKNIIVIDFGTATTCCVITANREYCGGAIFAGMRLSMEALGSNAAKLFPVEIIKPAATVGRTTRESLQAGLYYAQLGAVREFIARIKKEVFANSECVVLATGGFSHLFAEEDLFTAMIPELVLFGLKTALEMNEKIN